MNEFQVGAVLPADQKVGRQSDYCAGEHPKWDTRQASHGSSQCVEKNQCPKVVREGKPYKI
jgi:hypothetical protein